MIKKQADAKSSPEAKAERVRSARAMAGLSRRAIEEQYGLNENTFSGWERAIHGGLSRKGAARLTEILQDKNIQCSIDWLMHGIGMGPQRLHDPTDIEKVIGIEPQSIAEELLVFRKNHRNVLDFVAPDDSMAPQFQRGDYLAGIQHKQSFHRYIGLPCIVELINGERLLQILTERDCKQLEISSLAPVIFIRRTEESLLREGLKKLDCP